MAPQSSRRQRRIAAVEAALGLLEEYNVDQTKQIDVFGLCERLGLWLAFVPLDNLLGAFLPEGAGGVLITTQRPLTVQRYTAGHELGHWRMDHGPTADEQGEVFGASGREREQLAQVFAGALLMPPPLVFSVLEWARPNPSASLTPRDCYLLAREAGVSYEAALHQLVNLELVTRRQASDLLQTRPLAIKTELGYGRRPVNGWADVWPVDEEWNDEILNLHIEDEAVISLPENRTTGYRWMLADAPGATRAPTPEPAPFAEPSGTPTLEPDAEDSAHHDFVRRAQAFEVSAPPAPVLQRLRRRTPASSGDTEEPTPEAGVDVVGDDYLTTRVASVRPQEARRVHLEVAEGVGERDASESAVVAGTTGRRLLGVRFGSPGIHTVRLVYRSPYASDSVVDSYAIHAMVETRRTGIAIDQVATDDESDDWVREVRDRQATAPPPVLDPGNPDLAD